MMSERKNAIHQYPPERRHTRTTVIVDFVGGSAFGANAVDKFANGQVVGGVLSTIAGVCFYAKPLVSEVSYRRKLKKYRQSNS
jgi:hypothetical protein